MEWFPSSEESLSALIRERPGEGAVLTFGIVSECFWWSIFEPALRANDVDAIKRCLEVTERLLDEGDSVIQDALSIRVLDYLFDPTWQEAVLRYAGPKVRRVLTSPDHL
ncbi:DUF7674 family protein [Kribbella pratensis]|uniref:DUF7674 family protein n=1 Tax=Kribbella pratensis TaxID=2512112 RepID=UPI003F895031